MKTGSFETDGAWRLSFCGLKDLCIATASMMLVTAVSAESGPAVDRPHAASRSGETNAAASYAFAIVLKDTRTPVITDQDLVDYDFTRHRMRLRAEAVAKIPRFSASGRAFEVLVHGTPIYSGRFLSSISSMSFTEPVILVDLPMVTLTIDRDYPGSTGKAGPDPRSDERLRQALQEARKLTSASRAGNDEELTKQIGRILAEQMRLKPGMTREELLKIYKPEGGLSTANKRTFAHRDCPFIKVDVEFAAPKQKPEEGAGTPRAASGFGLKEDPSDAITRISRPYLDWAIAD